MEKQAKFALFKAQTDALLAPGETAVVKYATALALPKGNNIASPETATERQRERDGEG
jgi:hypothetical protein